MAKGSLGKESLVLTTQAEELYSGLKKSATEISKFKDKANKDASATGKGFSAGFKALGVAVAALGIKQLVNSVSQELTSMVDEINKGTSKLNPVDAQKILQANASVLKLQDTFGTLIDKIMVAFAPLIETIADRMTEWVERITPLLTWLGRLISSIGSVWVDIQAEISTLIWDTVSSIGQWIIELIGIANTSETVESVVTKVFKTIAIVAAYAWDAVKAGGAVFVYIASFAVDALSHIVDAFKETIKDLFSLAAQLPGKVGAFFASQIDNVDKYSSKLQESAATMRQWSKNVWKGFGNSVNDVEKWFAKRATPKAVIEIKQQPIKYEPTSLMLQNSKEANSIIARFQTENMINPQLNVAKQQLAAQNETNKLMKDAISAIRENRMEFQTV